VPTRAVTPTPIGATAPAIAITEATFARAGLKGQSITVLAAGGKDGQTLYAGGKGVSRSTDGGKTWTVVRDEKVAPHVAAIAIAPSDPQVVYVGVGEGCGKGTPFPGFVSTDGGATWQESGQGLSTIAIDPKNPKSAYAADCDGLVRTTNGGTTWTVVDKTLAGGVTPLIALAPSAPQTIYVVGASEGGTVKVQQSTDDGATWQDVSPVGGLTGPLSLAVDPDDPAMVLLSTLGGIERSTDGGKTWKLLTEGGLEATIPDNASGNAPDNVHLTTALVADPDQSGLFWVGTGAGKTKGIGIFRTRDGGESWRHTGKGIDGRMVQALALGGARNSRILYAATDDGIWALPSP
jgi:photosystem II stability/assembly factor-like uncharacterized protein